MSDPILTSWLRQQYEEGTALAEQSDLFDLDPVPHARIDGVPQAYVARFHNTGLVREPDGEIVEASEFHVGIYFPRHHLRHASTFEILTWLSPANICHPNVRLPYLCAGRIAPGVELVDLVYQVFEIISYHNWASHDALSPEAAQWARHNQHRFPRDRRPLKRRTAKP
jgi:hypothetical protein